MCENMVYEISVSVPYTGAFVEAVRSQIYYKGGTRNITQQFLTFAMLFFQREPTSVHLLYYCETRNLKKTIQVETMSQCPQMYCWTCLNSVVYTVTPLNCCC